MPPPTAAAVRKAGGRVLATDTGTSGPRRWAVYVRLGVHQTVGRGPTQTAAFGLALAAIEALALVRHTQTGDSGLPAMAPPAIAGRARFCGCGRPMRRGDRVCEDCLWRNRARGSAQRVNARETGLNRSTPPRVHPPMSDHDHPSTSDDAGPAAEADGTRRREFQILLGKMDHVQAALDAINKRAAKKGLPLVEYVWGAPYEETHTEYAQDDPYHLSTGRKVTIGRIPLTIVGERPSYAGWTFVATLQHLDGENIVRTVPGEILPPAYRHRGPVCDHCRLDRRRADTYVVRHVDGVRYEDGRLLQVGRTCLRDFLGSATAENVAAYAQWLADAADAAEDGEHEGGGGRRETVFTMPGYLAVVAAFVRVVGWLSRTAARERQERGEGGGGATADMAWMWMDSARYRQQLREDGVDIEITDADRAEAEAAIAWAEALTDAQIDAERGDYLHNLRAVVRSGMVTHRLAGLAGSVVPAYQRAIGQERKRAAKATEPRLDADTYVGTVGERTLWTLTLDHVTGWEGDYGYTTLLKFKTADGADVAWKASGVPRTVDQSDDTDVGQMRGKEISAADVGKVYTVLGTVKKHEEYKGRKQTQLARCELHEGVWTPPAKVKKAARPKPATTRTKEILDATAADDRIMVHRSYGKGTTVELWVNGELSGKVSFADFQKSIALGEAHLFYKGALDKLGGQSPVNRGPATPPTLMGVRRRTGRQVTLS